MSANVKSEIERRLKRKKTELSNLEGERDEHLQAAEKLVPKIEAATNFINELQSLLNLYEKTEEPSESSTQTEIVLRRGSDMWNAREVLRKIGRATYIDTLLEGMGKPPDARSSVSGQLGWYVRKGQVFTRPEPNTFGLKEWEKDEQKPKEGASEEVGGGPQPDVLPLVESEEAH